MDTDPFDIEKLSISAKDPLALMREACQNQTARRQLAAKSGLFTKWPYERMLTAATKLRNPQLAVLTELSYRTFRAHRAEVLLPNTGALRLAGVSPDAKVRALRSLEAIGMVRVDWRGGKKTPLVTVLWA